MMLPELAISVRQPWAWAIIHAGKDIENRSWHSRKPARRHLPIGKRICIHAAQGMTKAEYEDGAELITKLHGSCAKPHELVRGGIIGTVLVKGGLTHSHSPWFFGPFGIVLADPQAVEPVRAIGQLDWFEWSHSDQPWPEIAKWMLPKPPMMLLDASRDYTNWKPDPDQEGTL